MILLYLCFQMTMIQKVLASNQIERETDSLIQRYYQDAKYRENHSWTIPVERRPSTYRTVSCEPSSLPPSQSDGFALLSDNKSTQDLD